MRPAPFLRPALAGAAATCTGIGLARFAYVPLFPAMVAAGWVDGGGAGLLGAANFSGYLLGALGGRRVAARLGTPGALDLGMALAVAAFAACAWNGGLAWLACWRFLAGAAGGVLMALAGPAVQAAVPPARRGAAGGVVVAGVGSGVSLAALLVPALLPAGVPAAWIALAGLALGLWLLARPRWPGGGPASPNPVAAVPPAARLLLAYGLSGAGMAAPMVYLADLVVRGRGLGTAMGGATWLLFGLGAVAGTLTGGRLADRLGGVRAVRLWLLVQVAALALMLAPATLPVLAGAAAGGFAGIGITAVALARVREVAGDAAAALWPRLTAAWAMAQAATAFGLAALFAWSGEAHAAVFGAGLVLSLAALVAAERPGVRA